MRRWELALPPELVVALLVLPVAHCIDGCVGFLVWLGEQLRGWSGL